MYISITSIVEEVLTVDVCYELQSYTGFDFPGAVIFSA